MLGVAIINITEGYNLFETLINGVGGALGFTLAIVLCAGIRERLELSAIPKPDDAADALALAICHGQAAGSPLRRDLLRRGRVIE